MIQILLKSMDPSLYSHSLHVALPLMLFFGFHMLLGRKPEKQIFKNYILSRRLMGTALLVLAANYSVHNFISLRQIDLNATILFNLATYFLCYWLFSSAMMQLLDCRYLTLRRIFRHLAIWLTYTLMAGMVLLCFAGTTVQSWATIALAVWLVVYGLFLSVRLLKTYYRAIRQFENTHSDDIGAYIRWLSIFTYWAIGFGVSCALLTFLPDEYVFIWILSSVPFYIYLYCCYQNYVLFYETVETALLEDRSMPEPAVCQPDELVGSEGTPAYHAEMVRRITEWTEREGYCQPGITLNELSSQLCTNRTYLSAYINRVYRMNFRDWVSALRIEFAKRMMMQQPHLKNQEVAERSGFLSMSHFIRTFSEKEGCSPARWRKENHGEVKN